MPRKELKGRERRATPPPDHRFDSVLVSRFVGKLTVWGQKSKAEGVVHKAFALIQKKAKEDPLGVFTRAVDNVKPLLEVKPRRVGGATYQVPVEVRPERSSTLAMRWIIQTARARTGQPMGQRLADEIMLASKKEGAAFKKREDTHKMADANKAFAHYRW